VTNAITLYYAFGLDLVAKFGFLFFHDTKFPQTRTQYLEVERPLIGVPTQLVSKYQII